MEYRISYLARSFENTKSILRMIWQKIVADGLVPILFYDGCIQKEEDFLCAMMDGQTCPWVVSDEKKFVFFAWMNKPEGKAMRAHFTMFRDSWGRKRNALAIARHMLGHMLTRKDDSGYVVDTILGVTPVTNKLACRFALGFGMTRVGIMPNVVTLFYDGRTTDGLLTYATRESLGLQEGETVGAIWSE